MGIQNMDYENLKNIKEHNSYLTLSVYTIYGPTKNVQYHLLKKVDVYVLNRKQLINGSNKAGN